MNRESIFVVSFFDMFRWQIARYWCIGALIALLIPLVIWGTIFFLLGDLRHLIGGYISLDYWIIKWFWSAVIWAAVVIGIFFTSFFFSVVLLLVLGFFTGNIIRQVIAIHYPQLELSPQGGLLDDFFEMVRIILVYILYLIPVTIISIFTVFLAPLFFGLWGWMLFRRLLLCDVASQIYSSRSHHAQKGYWIESLVSYLLTLVPVVNLIAPICGVLLTGHSMLRKHLQGEAVSSRDDLIVDEASGD